MFIPVLIIGSIFIVLCKPFTHKNFEEDAIEIVEDVVEEELI
jgi:hypothetical protein